MNIDVKQLKNGGSEFLERCFDRFGSLNKNDYEVALFHLLLINGFAKVRPFPEQDVTDT